AGRCHPHQCHHRALCAQGAGAVSVGPPALQESARRQESLPVSRPPGFVEIRQDADICWLREDTLSTLSSDLFEPSFWQARNAVTGTATGRGTTWFVRDGERHLVLR